MYLIIFRLHKNFIQKDLLISRLFNVGNLSEMHPEPIEISRPPEV